MPKKSSETILAECIELENLVYLIDTQLSCLISLTKNLDSLEPMKGHELASLFEGLKMQIETVM